MSFILDAISGPPDYAGAAKAQEAQRQANVTKGTDAINQAYSGFNPQFYQDYAQKYQNFAMPQLGEQYNSTRNQVGFDLANRGILNSGAARTRWGNLADTMSQAKQGIVDTGQSQAQNLQGQVEASKNQQLQTLYSSADPANAGAGAVATAASFATPPQFSNLTNQFSNLLSGYYSQQLINAYRPSGMQPYQGPSDTWASYQGGGQ